MNAKIFPQLRLVEHPLAVECVTHLRDKKTEPREFHRAMTRLSYFLAYAALADLNTKPQRTETPLETAEFSVVNEKIAFVPVLRAGLGLVEGFRYFCPDAAIGYIGVVRDEKTCKPSLYLNRLPKLNDRRTVILDPMLATGGSSCMTLQAVFDAGAKDVSLVTVISAPEGVAKVQEQFPNVTIYTVALDRELNDKGYIVPGLGDAGDRMHGTVDVEV